MRRGNHCKGNYRPMFQGEDERIGRRAEWENSVLAVEAARRRVAASLGEALPVSPFGLPSNQSLLELQETEESERDAHARYSRSLQQGFV